MKNRKTLIITRTAMLIFLAVLTTLAAYLYMLKITPANIGDALRILHAYQIINTNYVEKVSEDTLITGAIKGMLNSLDDPHSIYMDSKIFKEFMIETEGSFGGVGIVIGIRNELLTVISTIEDSPSEKAGIKVGDHIFKIDNQETKDMPLDQAVGKIRGPKGSKIVLTIKRNGQPDQDYTLSRSNIQLHKITSKMLDDKIGYIRIAMFNENTGSEFRLKLQELEKQGLKALVLDLRDNPGGLLTESVKIASNFVPKGPVVSIVKRDGEITSHFSSLTTPFHPLAVLINGNSASASEIVAGAVQDSGVGTLVGTKTYGKASVQNVIRLPDDTAIKLTTAKYLTPKNRLIDRIGIEPDIKVELPVEDKENHPIRNNGDFKDIQLEKAVEVLKGKI